MISNRSVRKEVNGLLREVIIGARNARGLEIKEAADFLEITESELVSIEENPVFISSSSLQWIMKKYGFLNEFLDVVNISMTVIIKGHGNQAEGRTVHDFSGAISGENKDLKT